MDGHPMPPAEMTSPLEGIPRYMKRVNGFIYIISMSSHTTLIARAVNA